MATRAASTPPTTAPSTDAAAGTRTDVRQTALNRSLSPSRASDFMACPLRYRYRAIDRLPERRTPEAARGTLVHAVLERLFDLPPGERTPAAARALLGPEWQRLCDSDAELAEGLGDSEGASVAEWLSGAERLLAGYFRLEDPRRLQPANRELVVEASLDSGLVLRGVIDRLDIAPTGEMRIVDYKTGGAPGPAYESRCLFQMKFYALVLWRVHGRVPRLLQLLYLRDGQVLRYSPEEAELRATERKLEALWAAIERALQRGDFRPRPGPLCGWCDHQARCPAFGGTPPPLPNPALSARTEVPVPRRGSAPGPVARSVPGSVPAPVPAPVPGSVPQSVAVGAAGVED